MLRENHFGGIDNPICIFGGSKFREVEYHQGLGSGWALKLYCQRILVVWLPLVQQGAYRSWGSAFVLPTFLFLGNLTLVLLR